MAQQMANYRVQRHRDIAGIGCVLRRDLQNNEVTWQRSPHYRVRTAQP